MSKFLLLCALMVLNSGAWADITTQTIEYRQGDTRLLGYLAYPKDGAAKHPGVPGHRSLVPGT